MTMVPMTTLAPTPAPLATEARDLGVNFPVLGSSRSSTLAAKLVLSRALAGVHDLTAERIARLEDWRTAYPSAYVDLTRVEASTPAALIAALLATAM